MSHHEHDDLWQLLGRARQPAVSPFFARNVVREVRGLKQEGAGVPAWVLTLLRYWQIPAMAAVVIAVSIGAAVNQPPTKSASANDPQLLAMAEKVSRSPDFRVIGQLDELLESEHNSVWLAGDVY